MDVRLKHMDYEIDGHSLRLVCNMNVLADLQEECGDLMQLLETGRTMRSFLRILTAMVNDAMDAAGVDAHYTVRQMGRKAGWKEFRRIGDEVFSIFISAIINDGAEPSAETSEKKAQASEAEEAALTSAGT